MQISDLSILIPTYERPEYLSRQIAFLSSFPEFQSLSLFVLDGSSPEKQAINESITKRLETARYFHFDQSISFAERIYEGTKQVNTPLSVLLADDDFINPAGLLACISFLQENPDYSLVHGDYCQFQPTEAGEILFRPSYLKIMSYEQDNPLHRMFLHMHNYSPVFYAVVRTDLLRNIYQGIVTYTDLTDYKTQELLSACIAFLSGKVKKLDCFYMARESALRMSKYHMSTDKYILDPAFSDRYQRIKQCLKRYIDLSSYDLKYVDDIIDYSFSGYIFNSMINSPKRKLPLIDALSLRKDVNKIMNVDTSLPAETNTEQYYVIQRFLKEYLSLAEESPPVEIPSS